MSLVLGTSLRDCQKSYWNNQKVAYKESLGRVFEFTDSFQKSLADLTKLVTHQFDPEQIALISALGREIESVSRVWADFKTKIPPYYKAQAKHREMHAEIDASFKNLSTLTAQLKETATATAKKTAALAMYSQPTFAQLGGNLSADQIPGAFNGGPDAKVQSNT